MKTNLHLTTGLAFAMLANFSLCAEEPSPEIAGLHKTAEEFVTAFNKKDAGALAALFTEQGEITDIEPGDVISGRADIKAHYEEILATEDAPAVAVEVESVRIVAPGLAIEDGTVHFTPPGKDEPARSTTYTAVLHKSASGAWQIASSRSLKDATDAPGQLADLADGLKGDWTARKDGLRIDLALGWDDTGTFVSGELLTTTPDAPSQTTTLRYGWDAAKKVITCWSFDSAGGFSKAEWTPIEMGWQIHTEGTTSSGETMSANQRLVFQDKDTLLWTAKDRLVDGESLPDNELRVVRQAPDPAAE